MAIPETIGNYKIEGPLGKGSVGVVYQALAQDTGQKVALKLIPTSNLPTPEAREKFLQEAQAATRLEHPCLRRLYEVGESDDQFYLALEYLEGGTLKNLLVSGPVAEQQTALEWSAEMAEALTAVHEAGLAHGELTPAKVFITSEGKVKILDPGLWRVALPPGRDLSEKEKLRNASIGGSALAGFTPEQLRGQEPDARSDVFSLGVVVYHILTGRHPFLDPDPVQTMQWILNRMPDPPSHLVPEIPVVLDQVLERALVKDPHRRFQSAGEMAKALRAVAAGEEVPPELLEIPAVPSPRPAAPLWMAIGAAVLVLLIWFLYLAFTRP